MAFYDSAVTALLWMQAVQTLTAIAIIAGSIVTYIQERRRLRKVAVLKKRVADAIRESRERLRSRRKK